MSIFIKTIQQIQCYQYMIKQPNYHLEHCEKVPINLQATNNNYSITQPCKSIHSYGSIGVNSLLYFFIPLLVFACLFSYRQSVARKQQPPFPHATVTDTACHYPQDIVFRYFMLPAGGFISLIYFTLFNWLKRLKKKTGYPGQLFYFLYPLSQISILGFYGAIATIGQGSIPKIHTIGAIFFFVLLFIIAVAITLVMRDIHGWDSRSISRRSIQLKSALILYLFANVAYFFVGIIQQNIHPKYRDGEDIYAVIIQWNLTLVGMIWLLTFTLDWKSLKLTLQGNLQDTIVRK